MQSVILSLDVSKTFALCLQCQRRDFITSGQKVLEISFNIFKKKQHPILLKNFDEQF